MRSHLFSLLLIFSLSLPLHAVDFRVVSWEGEIFGIYFATGPKKTEIVANEGMYSTTYRWIGAGPLVIFREVHQEDTIIRVPVATLTPPTEVTLALLVLAPTDQTRTTYTGAWIDDSPGTRPRETITFHNKASRTIAVNYDGQERSIVPQASITFPTNPKVQRVPFKMAVMTGNGWKLVAKSSQPVRPERRTLVLLRDERGADPKAQPSIDMITLNDRLWPAPPLPHPLGGNR